MNNITNYTLKNGTFIGVAYIVTYILFLMMNGKLHTPNDMSGNINLLLMVAGIIMFTRKYRTDNKLEYFSYGSAFKVSFLLAVFSTIIGSFFLYVVYTAISPESIDQYLLTQQNTLLQAGYTEEQVEAMNKLVGGFSGPGFMAFSNLFGNTVLGLLVSLVAALILKKGSQDPNAFNRDMSGV